MKNLMMIGLAGEIVTFIVLIVCGIAWSAAMAIVSDAGLHAVMERWGMRLSGVALAIAGLWWCLAALGLVLSMPLP
jgi:hypothetical protein